MSFKTVAVVSDIHYAGEDEQARHHLKSLGIANPLVRSGARLFHDHVWLRDPTRQNHLLDQFLNRVPATDLVVANGDFSCDVNAVGLSDDGSLASARLCLERLQRRFGDRLHTTIGDHELGKIGMIGGRGGPRLESWRRATAELGFKPFWQIVTGHYVLMGITSTLCAWSVYRDEALPDEASRWKELSQNHLTEVRSAFDQLQPGQMVILFCHDPTALPCLHREPAIRQRLHQIETTIIGHLHSPMILRIAQMLSGMPRIRFLGAGVRRHSSALCQAKIWKSFRVTLCPALTGMELLKDGAFLTMLLSDDPAEPVWIQSHEIRR